MVRVERKATAEEAPEVEVAAAQVEAAPLAVPGVVEARAIAKLLPPVPSAPIAVAPTSADQLDGATKHALQYLDQGLKAEPERWIRQYSAIAATVASLPTDKVLVLQKMLFQQLVKHAIAVATTGAAPSNKEGYAEAGCKLSQTIRSMVTNDVNNAGGIIDLSSLCNRKPLLGAHLDDFPDSSKDLVACHALVIPCLQDFCRLQAAPLDSAEPTSLPLYLGVLEELSAALAQTATTTARKALSCVATLLRWIDKTLIANIDTSLADAVQWLVKPIAHTTGQAGQSLEDEVRRWLQSFHKNEKYRSTSWT